jgi:type IV secretory pathway VirB3-like protein
MGTAVKSRALLVVMTTIFAVLACDIAVPAVVLSLMAVAKLLVEGIAPVYHAEGGAA